MSSHYEISLELKARYITHRRDDIQICLNALSIKDYVVLERIGHQIKANSISYGFELLSPLAQRLETAAQDKNDPELELIIRDYQTFISALV